MATCEPLEETDRQRLCDAAALLVGNLHDKGLHITTAESCTGGMVAAEIVAVSGASEVFEEGYVTYSDRVKQKVLGVSRDTLDTHTAVSRETAVEMAEGAQARSGADLTISVTGYAGPGDGEDGTPAGTVYIGTWYDGTSETRAYRFTGGRNACRRQAAAAALEFALERIGACE